MIVVTQDGPDRWIATRVAQTVGQLRLLVRPDRRTILYLRDVAEDAYAPLVDAVLPVRGENLYLEVEETATRVLELMAARGFIVHRREHHYLVPTRRFGSGSAEASGACVPAGFGFISAAASDLDRLRELDDALRHDVPGAAGWRNDPVKVADQMFAGPEFDPATYLIAVEESTGNYAGLVRVWVRPGVSRLGLIAVLPTYRRRGLAVALIGLTFGVLSARGQAYVSCEVDETNVASNALMAGLGARRVGGAVELLRPAVAPAQANT